MIRLQEWSQARRARGGAPIKVRIVKGANLPMERVDAELHGWPLVTWPTKPASDAHTRPSWSMRSDPSTLSGGVGVAGHNLFDVALAWLLAQRRGLPRQLILRCSLAWPPLGGGGRKKLARCCSHPLVHHIVRCRYRISRAAAGGRRRARELYVSVFDIGHKPRAVRSRARSLSGIGPRHPDRSASSQPCTEPECTSVSRPSRQI